MSLRFIAIVITVLAIVIIGLIATRLTLDLKERTTVTTVIVTIATTRTITQTYTVYVTQTSSILQETAMSTSLNESSMRIIRIGPCVNGIPYYIGSMLYMCLGLEIAEKLSSVIQEYLGLQNDTQIIMFGLTSCPHCHTMHEFFVSDNKYRDIYIVVWLDKTKNEGNIFESLYIIEVSSGVNLRIAGAVPHIYVIKNGFVHSVVVGEITEETFWSKLIEQ